MVNKHEPHNDLIDSLLSAGKSQAEIVRELQKLEIKTNTSEFSRYLRVRSNRRERSRFLLGLTTQAEGKTSSAVPAKQSTLESAPAPAPAPTPAASKQDPDPLSFLMKGKGKFDFEIPTEEELKIEQEEAGKIRFGKK